MQCISIVECQHKKKKVRYSTADAATQAVRVVEGGRSRLIVRERRRSAEGNAMALTISMDGPAGLDGPRAAISRRSTRLAQAGPRGAAAGRLVSKTKL